jgi:ubiquinone/menaquinone biosynthesis C-methylase UbiE
VDLHPIIRHIIKTQNPETLREGFLVYTREAFNLLPEIAEPRILDIGCGSGLAALELAAISNGRITGVDIDRKALDKLNVRIKNNGLTGRINTVHSSLLKTGFPDQTFDLAWDEGTLHLLDTEKSAPEINRLLKSGGFLVMNETLNWLNAHLGIFETNGFKKRDQIVLPEKIWWTHYYAPLEIRIQNLERLEPESAELKKLKPIKQEIEMVKKDPGKFDCAFFILEQTG